MSAIPEDTLVDGVVGEEDTERTESLHELSQGNARRIRFNDAEANNVFASNHISTGKYNVFTFFPKFLFEQFKRYSNLFFLLIAIIQQIPDVSPTGRYTTIAPLAFILGISAVKELFEDWRRHRADDAVNHSLVRVLRDTFISMPWEDLKCGDIVKVTNGQFFPADLILLSSSEPMSMCYVETANLDGETNLKIRQGLAQSEYIKDARSASNVMGHVDCEDPNNKLYQFVGNLILKGRGERPNIVMALSPDQVLLRGAQLRNTEWVIGIVAYSGHESKVMQNSTAAPIKRSNVDRMTNQQIIFLFFMLLAIALFSSIANYIWTAGNQHEHWYLRLVDHSDAASRFKTFLTFIILYNNLIPISLTVTLEIVKFMQALFINWDLEMYDPVSDTPARARTSNLNEELGQVEYIFSDKTGTLTCNVMEFRRCTIAGETYGLEPEPGTDSVFNDPSLLENLRSGHPGAPFIREFLTILAVCHTVIPERDPKNPDRIIFQASSPDEGALVSAAKQLGFSFNVRTPESVVIFAVGREEIYEVLDVLEFNSDRKRMSVIVRKKGTDKIKLMCKGADSVIFKRLSPNQKFDAISLEHLEKFAAEGLRTLCIAEADIPPDVYKSWKKRYTAACQSLSSREGEKDRCCEEIEKDLFLLGATAIEDKLQDGVPQAIADFAEAGIKLWVLTGDKQETAINISYACQLLTPKMSLLMFNGDSFDECRANVERYRVMLGCDSHPIGTRIHDAAIIIDGQMLVHALTPELRNEFLQLALSCRAVVCCRVTPLQKADVVHLVKRNVKAITLAIGDGANDVGMIQAAHVGVGISGQEGLQAASSSDYSIAQFRFLKKLLLVHGSWSFIRLSRVILFSFYKNIVLYIMQLWFAILSGFSGQILFERWTIGLYNVVFTLFPPLAIGILDQTVCARNRMLRPRLYRLTQSGSHFKTRVFWAWIILALYHSFIIFVMGFATLGTGNVLGSGEMVGNWFTGTAIYSVTLIVVTFRAALVIDQWTWLTNACIWCGIPLWIIFLLVYCRIWPNLPIGVNLQDVDVQLFKCGFFWFMIILLPILAMSLDVGVKMLLQRFRSNDEERVMAEEAREGSVMATASSPQCRSEAANIYRDDFDQPGYGAVELRDIATSARHGFAFSQTESVRGGHQRSAVAESAKIRMYDTRPSGNRLNTI